MWVELSSTALAKCIILRSGSDPVQLIGDSSIFSGYQRVLEEGEQDVMLLTLSCK